MPSLRSTSGCGPTSNSYPALSRLFVEHIDPCCNDCDLTIGDNNIVVNTKDNRVGINTQFPTEALDVNGNIYTNGAFSADSADIGNGTVPGSTALTVTGDSDFLGNIDATGDIVSATIKSIGEANVGSLKVLGVSNLDGNLNVPAGNIAVGGKVTIGTRTAQSVFKYPLISMNVTSVTEFKQESIDALHDTIEVYFTNWKTNSTTTPLVQIAYTSGSPATTTYITSGYVGGTMGSAVQLAHSTGIYCWHQALTTSTVYNGMLTLTNISPGIYYYYGEFCDPTGVVVKVSGRVSYSSTVGRITGIRFTCGGLQTNVSSYMNVVGYTSS
jgi:hypothetical protein